MSETVDQTKNWVYYTLLLVLLVVAVLAAMYLDEYTFNPVTAGLLVNILLPIFVIAVFLERGQEVFVASWRGIRRTLLDKEIRELEKDLKEEHSEADAVKLEDLIAHKQLERQLYKAKTRRIAFLFSLAIGILISAVGVRALRQLTSMDADPAGIQGSLFNFVDIVLTGALIGGGSEGVHRVMSVLMDFFDRTRDYVNRDQKQPEVQQ